MAEPYTKKSPDERGFLNVSVAQRSLTLIVLFPPSLIEAVTAILFAPLWRNKVFAAPLRLVVTLDPSMFARVCFIPVITRRDDIAFTSRQLLVSRCWWRSLHVD